MHAALLLVLLVACGDPTGGSVEGPKIYASVCSMCHGETGKPDAGNVARLNVRDLSDPTVRAKLTPATIEKQVREGSANKLMPSFAYALTEEQIKAVAAYVASPAFLK